MDFVNKFIKFLKKYLNKQNKMSSYCVYSITFIFNYKWASEQGLYLLLCSEFCEFMERNRTLLDSQ